jgi:hypothetical protein
MDLDGGGAVVEHPPQIHRERLVRLLVEAELERGAGLVPAWVVVVPRGLVKAKLQVIVWTHPFARVDHAPLEGGVDLGGRGDDRRAARLGDDLAAEARDAHLDPLVVIDRVDLLPEPPAHLRGHRRARARHEVEGGVGLLPELEAVALLIPGGHALGVHPERDGHEPLERRLLRRPVGRDGPEGLDGALRGGVEALERRHDLAAGEDLDPEPTAAHLVDDLRQSLGCALMKVERWGPGRGHPPLDLRLRDDVGGIDHGGRRHSRHHATRLCEEPASFGHHALTPPRTDDRRPRRRDPRGPSSAWNFV